MASFRGGLWREMDLGGCNGKLRGVACNRSGENFYGSEICCDGY